MSEDRANVAARGADVDTPAREGEPANGARNERGTLTVLSYDLVGSTDLLARMDIEEFQELMASFQGMARDAISASSGDLRLEAGDGGIALFPMEIDAKDAASLAIRAGLAIVEGCRRVSHEKQRSDLHVRVGIATSVILVHENARSVQESVTGAAFAMATRLQTLAAPDTVLVSNQTRNIARRSHAFVYQGEHPIKGFPAPERVWRAASHKREVDRFFAFGRMTSPFIDRRQEFGELEQAWKQAAAGRGAVVLLEGEAGIGKSRLLHEVRRLARFQRGKLLLFQCMPGGTHSTLHPLAQNFQNELPGTEKPTVPGITEVFRSHGINDPEIADIFALLLGAEASDPALREADVETIRRRASGAVRRGLEAMCATGPLLLVIEDIHWIDPTSRQLLVELAGFVPNCPAMLVATARPETAGWLRPEGLRRIRLKPLEQSDARLAIDAMLPKEAGAAPEMLELMQRLSAGVPLFIEEMCSWMATNTASAANALAHDATADHTSVLENILEARLKALGPAREVARAAAVAGMRFTLPLLAGMLPEQGEEAIAAGLHRLGAA
ncbi:MAG: AAA family ATPase, partial [Rhizobiaceae bacterium]|nr:AAA family ATPase [Rhizobiaceae bacterium]